jgi:SAM-dependent methyltransferase
MYDYYLGGYHNFAIDRDAVDAAIANWPDLPYVMQANRAFLPRAVRFLVGQGIERFLDIGSGIPTVGSVHEVAQQLNPPARVVYVDSDPIAVAHSEFLVRDNPRVAVVQQDAAQVDQLLAQPAVRAMLDSGEPVAVLLFAVLHFIIDDQEAESVTQKIRDALIPCSCIAISHASAEGFPTASHERMMRLYWKTSSPFVGRTRTQIARFFWRFRAD